MGAFAAGQVVLVQFLSDRLEISPGSPLPRLAAPDGLCPSWQAIHCARKRRDGSSSELQPGKFTAIREAVLSFLKTPKNRAADTKDEATRLGYPGPRRPAEIFSRPNFAPTPAMHSSPRKHTTSPSRP